MSPSWDVLIATIPHRHEKLCGLLAELDRQWEPGLTVIVYRDNLNYPVGRKRQVLLEAASGDYVCFADDDDELAGGYVRRIMAALRLNPDYVGFRVRVSDGGEHRGIAEHSLRYPGWSAPGDPLTRDISHLNPVRRELALLGSFDGRDDNSHGEDSHWAMAVRASGKVRRQVMIHAELYHYRYDPCDESRTFRWRIPEDAILPLPEYPWLKTI